MFQISVPNYFSPPPLSFTYFQFVDVPVVSPASPVFARFSVIDRTSSRSSSSVISDFAHILVRGNTAYYDIVPRGIDGDIIDQFNIDKILFTACYRFGDDGSVVIRKSLGSGIYRVLNAMDSDGVLYPGYRIIINPVDTASMSSVPCALYCGVQVHFISGEIFESVGIIYVMPDVEVSTV